MLSFRLALGLVAVSFSTALTLSSAGNTEIVTRQTDDSGQDSRSCLSIKDVCDTTTIPAADASNAINTHPACIALVICETTKFFNPDFPPNQPRLTRETFNIVSKGSDVITQQQFIDFYYGTIASINATFPNGTTPHPAIPVYPSSANAVIGWWQNVVAWAGFCDTSSIPYENFADYIEFSNNANVCPAVQSCTVPPNPNVPPCISQPPTDNGSCGEVFNQCTINAGNAHNVFSDEYCVITSLCYYLSTVDVLITELHREDYLDTNPPVLSANQPRLSQDIFNTISHNNSVISQQNMIDAYYGVLTNTIQSCGGPPGAESPCSTGTSGPYPTDASYVIGFWEKVSAWTGFCATREIPYKNLADYLQFSSTVKAATTC